MVMICRGRDDGGNGSWVGVEDGGLGFRNADRAKGVGEAFEDILEREVSEEQAANEKESLEDGMTKQALRLLMWKNR